MSDDGLDARCGRLVAALGLGETEDVRHVRRLTGGVASDIAVVTLPAREICVKFALAKLRVAADWRAPTHRNRAEYEWLSFAGRVVAAAVPALYGWSAADQGFAMEYVSGDDVGLWKTALLAEAPDRGEAAAVGGLLGQLHAASAQADFSDGRFDNRDDFHAIRLEPYLLFTATRHGAVAERLRRLAADLYAARGALVHGDVSPKNILLRAGQPMFLDAECATLGDPCFDVAFCLNHLILKAIHLPGSASRLSRMAADLWAAYADRVDWEPVPELEARVAGLVPALMLARVDGKSPVEYLSPDAQETTRRLALGLLSAPPARLRDVLAAIPTG